MYVLRSCFLGLLFLSVSAWGQTAQPSPSDLFQRVRTRQLADAGRMSRYTCIQNITRHFYPTSSMEPQSCAAILSKRTLRKREPSATSWDRLQLDVAIADDREIHSWPDATKFNEEEIRKLVNNGPFGSGDFSAFVAGIFGGSGTVKFAGPRTVNGRALFEYTFSVTNNASHYQIATAGANVITAYDGSFLLDPQTADLVQLTVRTAELPEATNACQAISEIEYGRIDIHGQQVLIPHETNLRIVYRNGREAVATTSYSSCHEYTSKSVLRFDAAQSVTASAAPRRIEAAASAPPASPFPPGIAFHCRIVTPIDSDTPAGRPIEAILRLPLRSKNKAILAPQGARIRGRLVRLADHKSSLDYFEVGVRLESIEINGAWVPLYATLEEQAAPPVAPVLDSHGEFTADFPTAPPRNVGVFFYVREHLKLPQFDSAWITSSPETGKQNQTTLAATAQKQIIEGELGKFILAINDSQKAVDLQNTQPSSAPGNACDFPNIEDILAYRQKAIDAGNSTDAAVLNRLYPGLGDTFKSKFIQALSSFVRGCGMQSRFAGTAGQEVSQSGLLWGEWVDWYGMRRTAIEEAVNHSQLNSAWMAPSLRPVDRQESTPPLSQNVSQPTTPIPAAENQGEQPQSPVAQNPTAATPSETPAPPTPLATGSAILAELSKSLDAKKSKVGSKVEVKLAANLVLPGQTSLPRDTKIIGHISNAKANSKDSPGSMVEITFDHALLKDGRELPLQVSIQAIGRPIPTVASTLDPSLTQSGTAPPTAGAASGSGTRGAAASAPIEPPKNSNPDSGASMPGEDNSFGGTLSTKSQGIVGLNGLSLSTSPHASVIGSEKGNVHLDGGTQLILRIQ